MASFNRPVKVTTSLDVISRRLHKRESQRNTSTPESTQVEKKPYHCVINSSAKNISGSVPADFLLSTMLQHLTHFLRAHGHTTAHADNSSTKSQASHAQDAQSNFSSTQSQELQAPDAQSNYPYTQLRGTGGENQRGRGTLPSSTKTL